MTPGPDMSRPRWYATLTTLPNGEIYIQGGREGADRAEVRAADGSLRLLSGMDTSDLICWYPRNWVAPSGKIFGVTNRKMYLVDPSGLGTLTRVGPMPGNGPDGHHLERGDVRRPARSCASAAARSAGISRNPGRDRRGDHRHQRRQAQGHLHRTHAAAAELAQRHPGRRRPGDRDRRQLPRQPAGGRQRPRPDLESRPPAPGPRAPGPARAGRGCTIPPRCCCPTPRSWSPAAAPAATRR